MKYVFAVLILVSLVFCSCNNDIVVKKTKRFDTKQWVFSSPLKADFAIEDKSQKYDIVYFISHSDEYPFQNIYLRITDDFSGKINIDTLNIDLMSKNGFWKGEKNGDSYEYKIKLYDNFSFPENKNNFNIKIEEFTRQDTLKGILKTGIIVKKRNK